MERLALLTSILGVFLQAQVSARQMECSVAADVVFVLDASESIYDEDFLIQMDFVVNVTRDFFLNQTHGIVVGAVVYSSTIGDVIPLTQFKTHSELERSIRSFVHLKDGTKTALGIEWMRQVFSDGGREGVRRIGVVITDGRSLNRENTLDQAALARAENVTMIAVGVGIEIDFQELQGISSGSDFLFQVENYEALENLALNMTTTVCPAPEVVEEIGGCKGVSDVFFIIDGSESIFDEDFVTEIEFVKNITDDLYINGTDGFIVGALVYSSAISSEIHMLPSLGKRELRQALDQAWRIKAGTATDLGIRRAREIIRYEGRRGVRQVALVITDGSSKNRTATLLEADLLKDEGVEIFAIGIGPLINVNELYNIASNPEFIYFVDNFNNLDGIRGNVTALLCPQADDVEVTTVISPATTTPDSGICSGCVIVDGVGYNPHPSRCDWYSQCYPAGEGQYRVAFRPCPSGLFWDQSALTCSRPEYVDCPYDLCNGTSGIESVAYPGTCRAYWNCNNGRTVGAGCCARFQSFIPGLGCEEDFSCDDECILDQRTSQVTLCPLEEHEIDAGQYYQYEWGVRRALPCPAGTAFIFASCSCDFAQDPNTNIECRPDLYLPFDDFLDHAGGNYILNEGAEIRFVQGAVGDQAAYFDGTARVLVPRFSNHDFRSNVLIKLRYLRDGSSGLGRQEALVTNAACDKSPSIAVFLDRDSEIDGGLLRTYEQEISSETTHSMDDWNEVSFDYDGEFFLLRSNQATEGKSARGNIRTVHSALHIGDGAGFANFRGFIDEVYVYLSCRP